MNVRAANGCRCPCGNRCAASPTTDYVIDKIHCLLSSGKGRAAHVISERRMGVNPNVALMSAAVALLALVFAIFGAQWLNQRAIERLFEQYDKRMDERFAAIEQRLDRIGRQLEAIFKPMLP